MVTVSQFSSYKLYYKLDKDIACEKICQDLSQLIGAFYNNGNNSQDSILVLEIKTIEDNNTDLIPKIEHKNS